MPQATIQSSAPQYIGSYRESVSRRFKGTLPNFADCQLFGETAFWGVVGRVGARKVFQSLYRWYDRDPLVIMPELGQRLQQVGSIALPPFDGLDTVVLSFRMPVGWDGVINALVCAYTGTGFVEGSGDITWRLRLNDWWVRDYNAITVSLGDPANPYHLHGGGLHIRSDQRVAMYVNVLPAAIARLDPKSTIVCSLAGWKYPLT
jgi:hypothetical protein